MFQQLFQFADDISVLGHTDLNIMIKHTDVERYEGHIIPLIDRPAKLVLYIQGYLASLDVKYKDDA